jgi:tetratricopeptide (TPR) repeat protein
MQTADSVDKQISNNSTEKTPKKKNDRFNWWQSLLMITITLVISVVVAYFVSDKYLWSKEDQSQLAERLKYYKVEVDAKPNDPKTRVDLGYAYFLNGDHGEAIKQYKVALDLDKEFFDAYLNLGIVYNDEERYDEALEMSMKATELSPRDYKGFLLKGMAYRNLKMYLDASEALDQANRLMPGNTDIIFEAGRVAEGQGQLDAAEEIYKEALNYDPLYKPALEALDRLASK